VSLQDISQIENLVDVPENIMAIPDEEAKGIRVLAQFPTAPGRDFPLSIKEVATDADPATQTYQVVLQMPQPEGINVFPGMTATVLIAFPDVEVVVGRILIPAIAVVADTDGKSHVWIVEEKELTVHKREVDVGWLSGSDNIVIQKGLKGGETIVVAGVLKLKEGMKVRVWNP
jgi:RND family efflux transporter MFP subunit